MSEPETGSRLLEDLAALARIGRSAEGGANRVAWSEAEEEGKQWLEGRLAEAGLTVRRDAAGNVWGRWESGAGPALVLGSHIDSVPNGGHYDGALGVLAGLEAVRLLKEAGYHPPHPIEVVSFSDEEGGRFGGGFFGSLALVGELKVEDVAAMRDVEGRPATEVLAECGISLSEANRAAEHLPEIGAYLELHIEQGTVLEAEGARIGVVTAIKGINRFLCTVRGEANHAGTIPMHLRRDAGIGAARAILAVREAVREAAKTAVGTVGRVEFQPGGLNVIPGAASVWIELRDEREEIVARMVAGLREHLARIAAEEGLEITLDHISTIDAVTLDPVLQEAAREVCKMLSIPHKVMASGAGHDAMILARHLPAGMLFVPCYRGKSHTPEEEIKEEDAILAAHVLAEMCRSIMERGLQELRGS